MADDRDLIARSPLIPALEASGGALLSDLAGWRVVRQYSAPAEELAAAATDVVLADESPCGKFLLQGQNGAPIVEGIIDSPVPSICSVLQVEGSQVGIECSFTVFRLRADLFFFDSSAGYAQALALLLEEHSGSSVYVTDITHGRSQFRVVGPACRSLLSKLCGLDFGEAAFPHLACRETSLAQTKQLIARHDVTLPSRAVVPSFTIIGGRALGAYVWETIMIAGTEYGIAPMGVTAADQIREG